MKGADMQRRTFLEVMGFAGAGVLAPPPAWAGPARTGRSKAGFDTYVSASNYYDLDPVLARDGVPESFEGDGSDIAVD
jgi:hypothetical protein